MYIRIHIYVAIYILSMYVLCMYVCVLMHRLYIVSSWVEDKGSCCNLTHHYVHACSKVTSHFSSHEIIVHVSCVPIFNWA